jgi:hypothetical protein
MRSFYRVDAVPTNSCILFDTPDLAKNYHQGDIDLHYCAECGFISNMAFDPKLTEYSGRYEETQGFSETFNTFHHQLAERLIEKHDLRGLSIIEIGCGKGEFISLLCELGDNRGLGFDPGYREDHIKGRASDKVAFIKDFYSEKYSDRQADFICCKMTLEHIYPVGEFISMVRRAIDSKLDTLVFFQIPDATRILKECAFEDIYYEHCSYFTPSSLCALFRRSGFEIVGLETEYQGQYLTIEARPVAMSMAIPSIPAESELELGNVTELVKSFEQRCIATRNAWNHQLIHAATHNQRVVLWGSGSKGVSFLTSLKGTDIIDYVVDINPYRQGYYMAGTGQRIVAPEFLVNYQPDQVIVMNPIYLDEIDKLLKQLGVTTQLVAM